MVEVLEFIFRDFITWLGTVVLLESISGVFRKTVVNHVSNREEY